MDVKMADRDVIISYINLLKRENCQKLMLLLNNYWASAAFENVALDNRRIGAMSKIIREHASAIINICPDQPVSCEKVETRKRCNQFSNCAEVAEKKKKK